MSSHTKSSRRIPSHRDIDPLKAVAQDEDPSISDVTASREIDTIDLFYQHCVEPSVPIEDVAGAVKDLIKAGKVRHFSRSEAGVSLVRRGHAVQPVAALQASTPCGGASPRRLYFRPSKSLASGFIAFSPLGKGFLTCVSAPMRNSRRPISEAASRAHRRAGAVLICLQSR